MIRPDSLLKKKKKGTRNIKVTNYDRKIDLF